MRNRILEKRVNIIKEELRKAVIRFLDRILNATKRQIRKNAHRRDTTKDLYKWMKYQDQVRQWMELSYAIIDLKFAIKGSI